MAEYFALYLRYPRVSAQPVVHVLQMEPLANGSMHFRTMVHGLQNGQYGCENLKEEGQPMQYGTAGTEFTGKGWGFDPAVLVSGTLG